MRVLVLAVALVGCKDSATTKPATGSAVATPGDATPVDATLGPILDLVSCSPAPLPPIEPLEQIGGGRSPGGPRGGGGMGVGRLGMAGGGSKIVPTVLVGTTKENGLKGASALLHQRENRMRYCYEQAVGRTPNLTGSTTLQIDVKESGFPHEVIVENSIDNELSLCLKHIVMELKFPAPPKDMTRVTQPLTFAWAPYTQPVAEPTAWMPYASTSQLVPLEVAVTASVALQKVMPTAKIAECMKPEHTGSVRTIARIGLDGSVIAARTGGLGDDHVQACMSAAIVGVKTGAAVPLVTEVACDFVRGDPKPWLVDPRAGNVIKTIERHPLPDKVDPAATYTVLIAPSDVGYKHEEEALAFARRGAAYIVALDGNDGLPAQFLYAGRGVGAAPEPTTPLLLDGNEPLKICNGLLDATASAPFADAEKLLANAAKRCARRPCGTLLTISNAMSQSSVRAATLVAAARRAGFERIRLGSGTCPK